MSNKCFKTNPQLVALIADLKAKTREDPKAAIWRDIALSAGDISKKVNVAAYSFSAKAAAAIVAAGGKTMTIRELMDENPTGSKVRIMG